jgi:prepilin peptidase CpaA
MSIWAFGCTMLLATAAWWDLTTGRIPNQLVAIGLVWGLVTAALPGGIGVLSALLSGALGLLLFMPLYACHLLGAGDVKLLAAVGSFVGYPDIVSVALLTSLSGAALAVAWALRHGELRVSAARIKAAIVVTAVQLRHGEAPQLQAMATSTHRLPYALAIAAGTLLHIGINH